MVNKTNATVNRLRNVHEHLRHNSTSDSPTLVSEKLRLTELAMAREITPRSATSTATLKK